MKRFPLLLAAIIAICLNHTVMFAGAANALPAADTGGPAEIARFQGDASSATGAALGNGACDVNADGFDDAVVGAWFWDKGATANIGAAYVLLGGEGFHGASLGDPAAADAVRIDGPATANAFVGFAVACLGDVNGDGFDDIAISHYTAQRAYVVFGAKNFTGVTLDSLGDRGFVVQADTGNLGYSFGRVGDVNGDGKDDFAIAAVGASTQGRTTNGRVWVLAGRDDISTIDLADPAPGDVIMTVDGATAGERLGNVADVGDVNGDGKPDFLLGGYTGTPWGTAFAVPGAAYVVFGGTTGAVDTADLGTTGFAVHGPKRQRDRLGISVSKAGDVDGDGKADLLIGADGVANATTGARNGGAAVVLGSASTATVYTDPTAANGQSVFTCPTDQTAPTCVTPTHRGYWINGAVASDSLGYSVAGVGDVNGDGVPDFALGAWGYDPVDPTSPTATMSGAGAVYVVHGRRAGTGVQELAALTTADGYRVDGSKAGDRQGRQVASVGDLDGNGTDDVLAGADFASRPDTQNGEITALLLGALDTAVTVAGPEQVTPGQEAVFTATVGKPAGDQTPLAEGTIDFTLDGATVTGCGEVPVSGGTASCTTSFDDELDGDVVATFDGLPRLKSSASAPIAFAAVKTATTTGLSVSQADPRAGQSVQLGASVTDAEGAAVTTGSVAFLSDGDIVTGCEAVDVSSGEALCTTSWSVRGDRHVTAVFGGTGPLATSTSGVQTVSVGADAALRPAASSSFTYGTTPAALTGEVGDGDEPATGTVEVRLGDTVLGRATLVGGTYAVQLGATALEPGAHTLTVAYLGDDSTRPSERSAAVSVARATSRLAVTRSRGTLKGNQRLTLTIIARAPGTRPTGRVQVKAGAKVVKTLTLTNGRARYTLPKLGKKGKRTVSVVYGGSSRVTGDKVVKTVRQK